MISVISVISVSPPGRAPVAPPGWPAVSAALLLALAFAGPVSAEGYIWIDERGVTQLSNDPARVPAEDEAAMDVGRIRSLWGDQILGPPLTTPRGSSGGDADRVFRLLNGATEDLRRGETARAAATLRSVIRLEPGCPEAHWHLALLDLRRGRYERAEEHLRSFLSSAGDDLASWRDSAQQRLRLLEDERRLADTTLQRGELRFLAREGRHFRILLDAELEHVSERYAATVMRYLEGARRDLSTWAGVTSLEPLGVVFYGKAAYVQAHQHRFSFQTVGFFDGRIHVSSPAHPTGQLRSLLYHEYAHAIFRDRTGGDRPYWLNEGLAEMFERRSQSRPVSTRSERSSLRARHLADEWLPLRRLGPGFSGLTDDDAGAAYLESVVAVEWLEKHTEASDRARLLERLGEGLSIDQALHEAVGLDTEQLDLTVREAIRAEFPNWARPARAR